MTPRRVLAYGFLVTVAVVLLAASASSLFSFLDLRLYDTMLRGAGTRPGSARVAIVAVDDRSLAEMGQWPWSRDVVARLVEQLHRAGATVVALDLLLAEPDRFDPRTPPGGTAGTDAALAETFARGRVILAYALTFDDAGGNACVLHPLGVVLVQRGDRPSAERQLFQASGVTCSLPELSRAAGASGFVNAAPDRDGLLRRVPLLMTFRGGVYPSLALTAVRLATGIKHVSLRPTSDQRAVLTMDGLEAPLDERGTLMIRFRGKRGSFPQLSAWDVVNGRVAADALKDRIVFVGATALGTGDVVSTPYDTSVPGIEVHAAAADTLLQGDFVSTPSYGRAYEIVGTLVFGMTAATLIVVAGHLLGSALSVVLLGILWWATTVGVSSGGIFLSPLFPMLSVVSTLVTLTAARVRHERRRAEAERGRRERANRFTVQSLTSLVATRDLATGRHARRTREYARLLATRLSELPRFRKTLTPEYVDLVSRLAPLHDIGKVGIRDAVLHKPGPLSAEEIDEMRRHPSFGYDTLLEAERLAGEAAGGDEAMVRLAKEMVYTHHERWDGKGYPRGLQGEEIPIGGRIMAVVDVYDAVTENRPYHQGMTHEQAVSVIRGGRGTHFDPDVVDAFLAVEGEFRRLAGELLGEQAAQDSTPPR